MTLFKTLRAFALVMCSLFAVAAVQAQEAQPGASVKSDHARATLVLSHDRAQPGDTVWAALKIELDPTWHTYWRNPGDSGLPGALEWTLPAGVTAGDITWPIPERIPYGPLINFGYSNLVLLPVPLTIDKTTTTQTLNIDMSGNWLVCAEICIPDSGVFRVPLKVDSTKPAVRSAAADEIEKTLAALPKAASWPASITRHGGNVVISAGPAPELADGATATFFPFDQGLIDNAAVQKGEIKAGTLKLIVPQAPTPLDLPTQTGGLLVVQAANGASGFTFTTNSPAPATAAPVAAAEVADVSLWAAIVFAFLGGLILNLMPCVLPVLAMKALAFANHAGDGAAERRRDGIAYTLGVMATFGVLAGLLIGLRGAGTEIGWGFQLQSPAFVTVIGYVLLALGLNLSGVFMVGAGVMGVGQNLTQKNGAAGAFFTGALAVVVATPCTAPFMGAAVGYAMTQSAVVTLLVFESLALGLAAPFLLFSLLPQAAKILPRPGLWMERLKQILAFPLYASAAWMVWVLSQQVGPEGLAAGLAGLVLIALAAWLFGLAQTTERIGASAVFAVLAFIGAVTLTVTVNNAPPPATAQSGGAGQSWEPYSTERVAALRTEGRPVFVNFTAAWCITCLMNERVALSTAEVKKALVDNNVAYLKADWTNRDSDIAQTLASFGRSGVPLYVVYRPNNPTPDVLPQLLTPGLVIDAITAK